MKNMLFLRKDGKIYENSQVNSAFKLKSSVVNANTSPILIPVYKQISIIFLYIDLWLSK